MDKITKTKQKQVNKDNKDVEERYFYLKEVTTSHGKGKDQYWEAWYIDTYERKYYMSASWIDTEGNEEPVGELSCQLTDEEFKQLIECGFNEELDKVLLKRSNPYI